MSTDPGSLALSLFLGLIGMAIFGFGTKQRRIPQVLVGFVMMTFPMLVSSVLPMALIAVALVGALWLMLRLGW